MNYPDSEELRGKIGMEAAKIMKEEQDKLIKRAEEKIYHVSAYVTVNPPMAEKVGKFMAGCDLGVEAVEAPQFLEISYTTTTKPTKWYLKRMDKAIRQIENDGTRVIKIEWKIV